MSAASRRGRHAGRVRYPAVAASPLTWEKMPGAGIVGRLGSVPDRERLEACPTKRKPALRELWGARSAGLEEESLGSFSAC